MKTNDIKADCRYFLGNIPCKPNKLYNAICFSESVECNYYSKSEENILVIKLGAAGDVIRTTPLLYKINEVYPNGFVYWITLFPDLVPKRQEKNPGADKIYYWEMNSIITLQNMQFDLVINLDKDEQACSLTKSLKSKIFAGYTLIDNKPFPIDERSHHKYLTGTFDEISKLNKKNYMEEIFEICGYKYNQEEYILPDYDTETKYEIDNSKEVIGLNTGCGGRWTSRLWPENYWLELIEKLKSDKYDVILLGGPEEDEKNTRLALSTSTKYFGVKPLKSFIGLMNHCDTIVSAVTMGMHIAIGLKKRLILLNNIFNKHEFYLYGRGEIIEPKKPCQCYFLSECKNEEYKCIENISPEDVFKAIIKI